MVDLVLNSSGADGNPMMLVIKPRIELISPSTQFDVKTAGAPRFVLPGPFLDGFQACRWFLVAHTVG
jgi:hypothetical protein